MPIKILMPALSPTMTEGNLATWLKKEGDSIAPGDVIAEIETDKATMEVEAIDEGRLGKIVVPAGTEGVAVNDVIGLLLEEGEDEAALEGALDGGPDSGKIEAKAAPEAAPPVDQERARAPRTEGQKTPAPAARSDNGSGERIFASPLARRMAEKAGLDLAALSGSGPRGRIIKVDIEAALEKGVGKAAPPAEKPAAAPAAAPAPVPAAGAPDAPHTEISLSNMRKVIARRLTEAKQQIPHFYLTMDIELDALLELRKKLNDRPGVDYKLSVNDLIIKASAIAIRQKPAVNAIWGGDKIYQLTDIDVSVAVAIEGGLITPIIRKADQKGLATISAEMKDLAGRAREGKLAPHEFQGGGFTLSNLGMFGIKDFSAVINPPQACILAVGAGEQRPVVKNGALAIATVMSTTLSVDHRVVDGALGAEWLQAFKKLVEDPISLML